MWLTWLITRTLPQSAKYLISLLCSKTAHFKSVSDADSVVFYKGPRKRGKIVAQSLFPGMFLGLAAKTKKHFTGKRRFRMSNLGNTAYTTTESSQHCFLCAQTGKPFWQKQMCLKKVRNIFCFQETKNVSAKNVSFARKRGQVEGKMFAQRFRNNVFPFAAALNLMPIYSTSRTS